MSGGEAYVEVQPGSFEPERHYYPRVLNAQIHSLVGYFLNLSNGRIAERYCHLHPEVLREAVHEALAYVPRYFRWGGADLFQVTTERGRRRIAVIETNSCPSGQKSMPRLQEAQEQAGYRTLLERSFVPALQSQRRTLPPGGLAVLHDKNWMEVTGYAATLADLTGETVHLVRLDERDADPCARFTEDGVLEVRTPDGVWRPMRGALRYVTQRPWNRIPLNPRTLMLNPVLACVAGGRNKLLAAKAYDFHNAELRSTGLSVNVPETIWDVSPAEVPLWVQRMGGVAVVKDPYSNAGQGVHTITSPAELEAFTQLEHRYDRFIVQSLIGNASWSSKSISGIYYHVGTVPDKRRQIYVADMRFMLGASVDGFYPVAIYARRSRRPLLATLDPAVPSWDMLGTNLSVKQADGSWTTEPDRLLLMDSRDFNRLGIGLDDLIEGYIQTVLSVTAIDRMAAQLLTKRGKFRRKFFQSLNPDQALVSEIVG